ncbi:hypothetical protein NXT3_CH02185 [Sinorhizobium fredii]|uniref:Uncharacterized protein n=1 Tax=Rhizobium fredii TaxID=380 RepID=A0A2L0H5K2_RHIFR|nr:hypothetical protein NXT3_CH02185 [Sinorhizobium fredii]
MFCNVAHSLIPLPPRLRTKDAQHFGRWAHSPFRRSNPVAAPCARHGFGLMLPSRRIGTGLNAPTGGAT